MPLFGPKNHMRSGPTSPKSPIRQNILGPSDTSAMPEFPRRASQDTATNPRLHISTSQFLITQLGPKNRRRIELQGQVAAWTLGELGPQRSIVRNKHASQSRPKHQSAKRKTRNTKYKMQNTKGTTQNTERIGQRATSKT